MFKAHFPNQRIISFVVVLCLPCLTYATETDTSPSPSFRVEEDSTQTQAQRILTSYKKLHSVVCVIRKVTRGGQGPAMRLLSRVHYQNDDHIHVQIVSPSNRRIIADGKKLYYYEEGMPRGFSRPIEELSDEWLQSLRNVPGTAVEHLEKLKSLPESQLPPSTEGETRVGYVTESLFVILHLDPKSRLTAIMFYKTPAMETLSAEYRYADFIAVADDCWIPTRHEARIMLPDGETLTETRRIMNLEVNTPVAANLFDHDLFFKDVTFVDTFSETFE